MAQAAPSAVERAIAFGLDVSLLIENLRLTPTQRLRRGEAFARFAWEVRQQGRLAREGAAPDAAQFPYPLTTVHSPLTSGPWFVAVRPFGPAAGDRWRSYVAWSGLAHLVEVVTLDVVLCPNVVEPLVPGDWGHNVQADFLTDVFWDLDYLLRRVAGEAECQVLAVLREPGPHSLAWSSPGFEFQGFDLVEAPGLGISALTNCGGFPRAFTPGDLNLLGLLPALDQARSVQAQLRRHYPAEPHAECNVWAIWRLGAR